MFVARKNRITRVLLTSIILFSLLFQTISPAVAGSSGGFWSPELKAKLQTGIKKAKGNFSGLFTPTWFLKKVGVQASFHILDCVFNDEPLNFRNTVKSMFTAEYLAGTMGGTLGCAAGTLLVPFLAKSSILGTFLVDWVPTLTYYLGSKISKNTLKEIKSGKFSLKKVFSGFNWGQMISSSLGWSAGSMLGACFFPPIGGMLGGVIGSFITEKVYAKVSKFFGKDSPRPPPTHEEGPITLGASSPKASFMLNSEEGQQAFNQAYSPSTLPTFTPDYKKAGQFLKLRSKYQKLYKKYISTISAKNFDKANQVAAEMKVLKEQINILSK
jgi:hypothetical protein